MVLKLIAVQGMTVEVDQGTVTPPTAGDIVATIVVKPPSGTKGKGEGNLVQRDGDLITVTAITAPNATPTPATIADPGPYDAALESTQIKVKELGVDVLRVDDQTVIINATPQIPNTPTPIDYPITFKCIITDPGQTTSKAQ